MILLSHKPLITANTSHKGQSMLCVVDHRFLRTTIRIGPDAATVCDSHQHYHSVIITQFARKTGHDHYHSEALCIWSSKTHPHGSTTTWWTDSNATDVSILRPQKTVSCFVCYKIIWERKISMVTLQSQQTHARMTTNNVLSLQHQPQTTRLCGELNHSDWRHKHHRRSGHGEYLTITLICILARSILTWIFRRRPKIRTAHHLEETRCR